MDFCFLFIYLLIDYYYFYVPQKLFCSEFDRPQRFWRDQEVNLMGCALMLTLYFHHNTIRRCTWRSRMMGVSLLILDIRCMVELLFTGSHEINVQNDF